MKVEWGGEDLLAPWIADRCGLHDLGECRTAAVIDREGKLAAAVAFHNWAPDAGVIEVSAAARDPRWATREVLRTLFGYVFSIGQAAVARTAEDNHRTRRLWKAFGAEEYIIPRLRGREASEAVLLLTDDAWAQSKFMRQEHGQRPSTRAA